MKKILSLLMVSLLSLTMWADASYTKVTSAPTDWAGEYILVYEDASSAYVFNGVDAADDYDVATPSDNTISGSFVTITVAAMEGGYSIKVNGGSNNGKFITSATDANGLAFGGSAVAMKFAEDTEGVLITNPAGAVMRFNKNSNQMRFRFYKKASYANQQPVQLYKVSGEPTPQKIVASISVTGTADDLLQGDAFSHNGITVTATYSDETTEDVTAKADYSGYDMSKAGTQTVTVTYGGKSSTYSVLIKERGDVKLEDVNTIANIKACQAAGILKDDDVVTVKGYIANMFLKPTNFAKYGSVCIWLTDTQGGSDKEFELFNCYGLNGDTLKTFAPTATGTSNVDVTSVGTDKYAFSVGDYVEATGKFKLFNTTYELQQGCYLSKGGTPTPTSTKEVATKVQVTKMMINGQLVIVRDGVKYGAMGQIVE